jgi:O-antigen/teichoic acid export membrane protein
LDNLKRLAGQTFWYGFSSIFGRFLNYLLTPVLTGIYSSAKYGDISILFALAAFLNIVFTFGMETSYFRFSREGDQRSVYDNGLTMLLASTAALLALLLWTSPWIAARMKMPDHPEYVRWVLWIVALDTLAALPFARLRQEGRPIKFATVKILNIAVNVGLVLFFLVLCKGDHEAGRDTAWARFYNPSVDIGYVFVANLAASALTLLMLGKELASFRPRLDVPLLKRMLTYTAPLIVVGFGGMVNETIDRFMITNRFPGTVDEARSANGIYSANYKLAVVIVLFIQAFRMGAEPFFFRSAGQQGSPRTYARVMKFFVLACCFCFLGVVLYLDVWKHFMGIGKHPEYLEGLRVVPILMLSKIMLGVYYNLSIWYKLTDRTLTGAWITLGGALITVAVNYLTIPWIGYMGSAIATLLCYGFMMVTSYRLGQKHYPVPYPWKKLTAYVVICLLLFGVHRLFKAWSPGIWWTHGWATLLMLAFSAFVARMERRELASIPLLSRLPGIRS